MSSTFIYDLATRERKNTTPSFKQYDEGQLISVELTKNGEPFDLANLKVTAFYTLPNGAVEQVRCETAANKVLAILGGKLLLYAGYVTVDFKIYNTAYTTVTTFTVDYNVTNSVNGNISGSSTGGNIVVSPPIEQPKEQPKEEPIDPKKDKYAVLVLAGQSNSVGYDESAVNPVFDAPDERIKQLGYYNKQNMEIIPLTHCAQNLQNMSALGVGLNGTKGLHLPLSKLVLKHIPDEYKLLVIPVAYGGTAFTKGDVGTYNADMKKPNETTPLKWGANTPYYQTLVNRIKYALDLNSDNYYLGMVWCQGEFDNTDAAGHKNGFESMMTAFFAEFNTEQYKNKVFGNVWGKEQVYIHDSPPTWDSRGQFAQIKTNYKNWAGKTYVELAFGTQSNKYTNETNGAPLLDKPGGGKKTGPGSTTTDQPTHFGNNAYATLVAPAVYKKMLENNLFNY